MTLSDAALDRLRAVVDEPDLTGTRYDVIELLGRGGMGAVWRVVDRELEREVALKVLFEPVGEAASGASAATLSPSAEAWAARLRDEAKVLATLEHPGIVPVHDAGTLADGRVFYAMKLVRGPRLDQLVRAGLAESERFRIFARICEAVAFAHARGVLHRDLKPQNIMVGEFGEVLVLDWGLALRGRTDQGARAEEAARTEPAASAVKAEEAAGERRVVGTTGFMAPEQQRGGAIDVRADVYSLGKLLAATWSTPPGRPFAAIVALATREQAEERYRTVLELAADVARLQLGEAVRALPESWRERLARNYRRYRAACWLIGTYLVLRVAFELARPYLHR